MSCLKLSSLSLNFRGFQFAQAMLFAIEEINNSTDLLPGVNLGYKIYNACGSMARSVKVALALVNGNEIVASDSKAPCTRPAQVQAILGETSSSPSAAIATVIGPFHIPVVGRAGKTFLCWEINEIIFYAIFSLFHFLLDQPLFHLCLSQ